MSSWTTTLGLWLADFYLLATFFLLAVSVATFCIRQQVRRLAIAWGAMIGLVILAVVCSLPTWPRLHVLAAFQDDVAADSFDERHGSARSTAGLADTLAQTEPHDD